MSLEPWQNLCVDNQFFEDILTRVCERLSGEASGPTPRIAKNSDELELFVRNALTDEFAKQGQTLTLQPKVQEFPDVVIAPFGIEIKHTEKNTWVSIANSIRESHRPAGVARIYVVFGKYGGDPKVRWGLYENVVNHARTSHVPRFQIDMNAEESFFEKMGVSYVDFSVMPMKQKMAFMRTYARGRRHLVKDFWWLEDDLRPFRSLSISERRELIAQACFLVPEIVTESQESLAKAAFYLASIPHVLSHQMLEDVRSAYTNLDGTDVASNNGLMVVRELEQEIILASENIAKGIIKEFWGIEIETAERLVYFVQQLDHVFDSSPKPSAILFGGRFSTRAT
jgi:hypothetical protein